MLSKMKNFAMELHEDEAGPNTVEWVLLIMVALILLVVIVSAASWAVDKMNEAAAQGNDDDVSDFDDSN